MSEAAKAVLKEASLGHENLAYQGDRLAARAAATARLGALDRAPSQASPLWGRQANWSGAPTFGFHRGSARALSRGRTIAERMLHLGAMLADRHASRFG
jgi:hypothetical protein